VALLVERAAAQQRHMHQTKKLQTTQMLESTDLQ